MSRVETGQDLFEVTRGYWDARIILTGVETDVFNIIGKSSMSSRQIADKGEFNVRATAILLDALTALGLLNKEEDRYSLTDVAAEYLSKESEGYIGATMMHSAHLWENWSNLTSVVRGEASEWMFKSPKLTDPVAHRAFILCMHDLHYSEALKMVQYLDLTGVKHVVDLGGGPGSFSIAFVRHNRDLKATIIDFPQTLEVTQEVVGSFELLDRIECKAGDIYNDLVLPIGNDVDLFFVSNLIHSEGYDDNAKLMKRLYSSLLPGGRVIINDIFLDDSGTEPASGAVFAVNMLVNTARGKSYKRSEIEKMLSDAGFEVAYENNLYIGRKKPR